MCLKSDSGLAQINFPIGGLGGIIFEARLKLVPFTQLPGSLNTKTVQRVLPFFPAIPKCT